MVTLQNIIETNIATCENPANRIITECEFYAPNDNTLEIWIRSNCNGWCEDVKCIGTYVKGSNTTTFVSNDFIGLTEEQASKMIEMSFHTNFIMIDNTTVWIIDELIDELE